MAAAVGAKTQSDLLSIDKGRRCPQPRLLGHLNFGPRYIEDFVTVTRPDTIEELSLCYRIYNPSSIHSAESPPLVVVHGGPSLPSNYLYPLAQQFPNSRSIIFYDQLGCGQSSRPEDKPGRYSLETSVNDLGELVQELQLDKFHLLGHSFGGIIAYEYVATGLHEHNCLSLTLNSTPSSMKTSLEEWHRLENEVKTELLCEDIDIDSDEANVLIQDRVRRRNECRLDKIPDPLIAAIEMRGTIFGPEDVAAYVAQPPPQDSPRCVARTNSLFPPVLLIRGQHDFITEECIAGWREIFSPGANKERCTSYREEEMNDCAHYCHLEDAERFGDLVKSHCFINDY